MSGCMHAWRHLFTEHDALGVSVPDHRDNCSLERIHTPGSQEAHAPRDHGTTTLENKPTLPGLSEPQETLA